MSKRISHSLLDPWLGPPISALYRFLPIPAGFPPEGIVVAGHLLAIAAAVGFAYSTSHWWGGVIVAVCVAGNHFSDCIDGKHARTTGQCRDGGELLDHFLDPISFSYYLVGIAYSVERLDLGMAAVIVLLAMAVLTNIKAKMLGEFTLSAFGPTEFKTLLVLFGVLMSLITGGVIPSLDAMTTAIWIYTALIGVGVVLLNVNVVRAVIEVNARGPAPDTTEWVTRDKKTINDD